MKLNFFTYEVIYRNTTQVNNRVVTGQSSDIPATLSCGRHRDRDFK
jgi:hypothetical protein